jgi:DNA-binding beta-propeller fold protein YncE
MRIREVFCATAVALAVCAGAARAELAVSANDGKQMEVGDTVTTPQPDSISVLDISAKGVRKLASLAMPAGMIGPPGGVALTRDSRLAIVTAYQKLADGKLVSDDKVRLVDLGDPSHPRLLQTVKTGSGPMGVSISPDGKLVLVAGNDTCTATAFSLSGDRLTKTDELAVPGETDCTDAIFTRDGKHAVLISRAGSKLFFLDVKGDKISRAARPVVAGHHPYGAVATFDGKYLVHTNLGGKNDPGGTIAMIALSDGHNVATVKVGPTPEHVVLSADGKYLAVVVANNTARVPANPGWGKTLGLLKVYRVGDGTLTLAAQADTGHWGQGATFGKDGKTILMQCAGEREIEVFHFDGSTLIQDKGAAIAMGARPGSIATALSR